MATKMAEISRAVPGAERKRTKLKAPATATPVPTLPLTIINAYYRWQESQGNREAAAAAGLPSSHGAQQQSQNQRNAHTEKKVSGSNGIGQGGIKQSAKYSIKHIFFLLSVC